MTIPAGYIELDELPDYPTSIQLLTCNPKAGLWLNSGVPGAVGTISSPGRAAISFGAIDAAGVDKEAQWRNVHDVVFEDGHAYIVDALTGGLFNVGIPEIDGLGFVPPGWSIRKDGTASGADAQSRAFFLALQGDTMESAAGEFTLDTAGTGVSISGLPFQPDLVIVFGAESDDSGAAFNVGALDLDGNSWSVACASSYINVAPPLGPVQHQAKSNVLCLSPPYSGGFVGTAGPWEATGVITGDGFDITQVDAPGSPGADYAYIAIHDPNGEFHVSAGEIGDGFAGCSQQPEAVLFASVFEGDESSHNDGARISLGYLANAIAGGPGTHTDATKRVSIYTESAADIRWRSNSSLINSLVKTDVGGSVVAYSRAALTPTGFTISSFGGSSSNLAYYVTMRGSPQADCPEFGGFLPHIYRLVLPI